LNWDQTSISDLQYQKAPLAWTDETLKTFILIVCEAATANSATENGFKKQVWTQILTQFNKATRMEATAEQDSVFEGKIHFVS
jgi:hypothetical protein